MDGPDQLIGLIGPRLPEPGLAEALAAFALGLALAALIAAAPLLRRAGDRRTKRRLRLAAIAAAEALPEPERGVALLRLAQETAGPGEGPWRARAAQRLGLGAADLGDEGDAFYQRSVRGPANAEALARALRRRPV